MRTPWTRGATMISSMKTTKLLIQLLKVLTNKSRRKLKKLSRKMEVNIIVVSDNKRDKTMDDK